MAILQVDDTVAEKKLKLRVLCDRVQHSQHDRTRVAFIHITHAESSGVRMRVRVLVVDPLVGDDLTITAHVLNHTRSQRPPDQDFFVFGSGSILQDDSRRMALPSVMCSASNMMGLRRSTHDGLVLHEDVLICSRIGLTVLRAFINPLTTPVRSTTRHHQVGTVL